MVDSTIIGLETDEPVKQYLHSRNYTSLPFPIQDKETMVKVGPTKSTNCIAREGLYRLIDEAIIPNMRSKGMPVFVYGSSRYHHICHGILKRVIDPTLDKRLAGPDEKCYSIFLVDNHEDIHHRADNIDKTSEKLIHCGTHIADSVLMADSYCKSSNYIHFSRRDQLSIRSVSAYMHKKPLDLTDTYYTNMLFRRVENNDERDDMVEWYNSANLTEIPDLANLMVMFMLPNVYATIDIDALSEYIVDIARYEGYNQGNMALEDMLYALDITLRNKHVIGIDITGMTPDPRCQKIYDSIIATIKNA
jgi:hypothetical protein